MTPAPAITLRPYRAADRAAVERICIETADAGRDATLLHPDPRAVTDRWATPYLVLEPERAAVAELDGVVVGYVLGTADTRSFAAAFEAGGWADAMGGTVLDAAARREHADHMLRAEYKAFPAHLHIDLSEAARGAGVGRRLIERFAETLAPGTGLHVVVDPENAGALAFYPRVGFERLSTNGDGVVFVLIVRRPA